MAAVAFLQAIYAPLQSGIKPECIVALLREKKLQFLFRAAHACRIYSHIFLTKFSAVKGDLKNLKLSSIFCATLLEFAFF